MRRTEATDRTGLDETVSLITENIRREGLASLFLKTGAAQHGAALGRLERDGGLVSAGRAGGPCLWPGTAAGGPFRLARFATLVIVGEMFLAEEQLLSSREDEVISAINALEDSIRKFHVRLPCVRDAGSHKRRAGFTGRTEHTYRFTTGPVPHPKGCQRMHRLPAEPADRKGKPRGKGDDLNLGTKVRGILSRSWTPAWGRLPTLRATPAL